MAPKLPTRITGAGFGILHSIGSVSAGHGVADVVNILICAEKAVSSCWEELIMRYVVTFDDCGDKCDSIVVSASCIEIAIMEAKKKANDMHLDVDNYYCDSDILSVIRI